MKKSHVIALSALTTALATILLVFGNWFTTFSLSGAFMASLVMMLPLAKRSYKGALLSYLATVLLTGIFSGFFTRWEALLPFAIFSGLHPIVNYFFAVSRLSAKTLYKVLFVLIKDVWFVGALVVTHLLTKLYIGDNEFINTYIFPILIIGGALVFPLYDLIMTRFQVLVIAILIRLKL